MAGQQVPLPAHVLMHRGGKRLAISCRDLIRPQVAASAGSVQLGDHNLTCCSRHHLVCTSYRTAAAGLQWWRQSVDWLSCCRGPPPPKKKHRHHPHRMQAHLQACMQACMHTRAHARESRHAHRHAYRHRHANAQECTQNNTILPPSSCL